MSEITQNLIVVAVTAIFVILLFFFLNQKKKRRDLEFRQMAQEKGWKVERIQKPLVSGYILFGKDSAGHWTLETLATSTSRESGPGSSEVSHSTRWWSEETGFAENTIVIGPGTNLESAQLLNSFGAGIFQQALRLMLGKDAEWASSLTPVQLSRPSLQNKFLVLADHSEGVEDLIGPELEKALLLLARKHKVITIIRAQGVEIRLPEKQVLDRATLEQIVDLGKTLRHAVHMSNSG